MTTLGAQLGLSIGSGVAVLLGVVAAAGLVLVVWGLRGPLLVAGDHYGAAEVRIGGGQLESKHVRVEHLASQPYTFTCKPQGQTYNPKWDPS